MKFKAVLSMALDQAKDPHPLLYIVLFVRLGEVPGLIPSQVHYYYNIQPGVGVGGIRAATKSSKIISNFKRGNFCKMRQCIKTLGIEIHFFLCSDSTTKHF